MKYFISVSNYGLQEIFDGHESHKITCKKCGKALHHPLGVAFSLCNQCGNAAYDIRWCHITNLVKEGKIFFCLGAKNLERLQEMTRNKLVELAVLYDDWTETSVATKNFNI